MVAVVTNGQIASDQCLLPDSASVAEVSSAFETPTDFPAWPISQMTIDLSV